MNKYQIVIKGSQPIIVEGNSPRDAFQKKYPNVVITSVKQPNQANICVSLLTGKRQTQNFYKGILQEQLDQMIEAGNLDCFYTDDDFDFYYVDGFLQNEDTENWEQAPIYQKRIYFGDTTSDKVVKVDSSKWSSIDGLVLLPILTNQGRYKGNFEFVYGIVDSID